MPLPPLPAPGGTSTGDQEAFYTALQNYQAVQGEVTAQNTTASAVTQIQEQGYMGVEAGNKQLGDAAAHILTA